jgi:hypothetical protein
LASSRLATNSRAAVAEPAASFQPVKAQIIVGFLSFGLRSHLTASILQN